MALGEVICRGRVCRGDEADEKCPHKQMDLWIGQDPSVDSMLDVNVEKQLSNGLVNIELTISKNKNR